MLQRQLVAGQRVAQRREEEQRPAVQTSSGLARPTEWIGRKEELLTCCLPLSLCFSRQKKKRSPGTQEVRSPIFQGTLKHKKKVDRVDGWLNA